MNTSTQEDSTVSGLELTPRTIRAFAEELLRLAKDTKNLVSASIASPRVLSNLAAMQPIIALLSDQEYSTILNLYSEPKVVSDEPNQNVQGISPAGYL